MKHLKNLKEIKILESNNFQTDLYLVMGYNNVSAWNENELDEIDLDKVIHKNFDNEKEKQIFIDALYLLDNNLNSMSGNYLIIDEDEYHLLTK